MDFWRSFTSEENLLVIFVAALDFFDDPQNFRQIRSEFFWSKSIDWNLFDFVANKLFSIIDLWANGFRRDFNNQ